MENGQADGIHVVIIGAGLAGLATALATKLANAAHAVTVCEAVKDLQEVGVSFLFRNSAEVQIP